MVYTKFMSDNKGNIDGTHQMDDSQVKRKDNEG